jgi:NAD(P)-dependent dehydrogenase (short-subunit alcohol dehydrogenase family)
MKTVVITGSTRGIGHGLADAFLGLGCAVAVSGRTAAAVDQAVAGLGQKHAPDRILGQPCDVTDAEQVQALWDTAYNHWGKIDIWINNAGIAHNPMNLWEHPPEEIEAVISTNVIGSLYGARVAVRGMLAQGFGSLYLLEGLGSGGRSVEGLTLYAISKHALTYLTDGLVRETRDTPVRVGALRPGMVVTDMLTRPYVGRPEDWERAKPVFNILADRVETVTPWLARKILDNTETGVRFIWLNRWKAMARFLRAPFRSRDLFGEEEN